MTNYRIRYAGLPSKCFYTLIEVKAQIEEDFKKKIKIDSVVKITEEDITNTLSCK